ncbi:hypothetical protein SLS62_010222 [Diatrype stigma]|uniref:Uncharacterized protein n=1 Tax=Diatrype stigma TaxID=117547 RepID=A0AAN9UAS2_9PEZI
MRTRGRKQVEDGGVGASSDGSFNSQVAARTTSSESPTPASPISSPQQKQQGVVRIKNVQSPNSRARGTPSRPSSSRGKGSNSCNHNSDTTAFSPSSGIPALLRFPLIVLLNIALSALGSALAYPYTKAVVANHERPLETWEEAAVVLGWRIVELGLGWFGDYDSYDLTAMNILSHGPPLYLLYAFYEVPAPALLLSLGIETLATYLPFRLLRPLSPAHAEPSRAPNAEIVTDRPIALLTTLLAGAIYSVTLFCAYATYLPTYLAAHFRGVPTLAAAHEGTWVNGMLPSALALGFAARAFVFASAESSPIDRARQRAVAHFDPATASLAQTLRWNGWWGWSDAARAVTRRTLLLTVVTGANAFVHARLAVRGVDNEGAAAWAAVWVVAAALTGLALGVVGRV